MAKVEKLSVGTINIWYLNQTISGLVFVKPNIPALKYGRDMKIDKAIIFIAFLKEKHKEIKWMWVICWWNITMCKSKPRQNFVFVLWKDLCGNQISQLNKLYKTMLF